MAIRVSPGAEHPHERHGHQKSAQRNGTQLAETIRASGKLPRKQAGHRSVPDQGASKTQKRPCNAGDIHTGRSPLPERAHLWTGALWQEIYSVICSLAVSGHLFGLFGRLFRYRGPSCVPQDEVPNKSPHLMVLAPIWVVFTC